ncbi:MAG: helix-turn-helix domain-containing protein [Candidatus Comchoanobacterales bacterium]
MNDHTLSNYVAESIKAYLDICDGNVSQALHAYVMEHTERLLLQQVLEHTEFNQTRSAEILGISRVTLKKKLVKYQIPNH